jgi:hypothetical protein
MESLSIFGLPAEVVNVPCSPTRLSQLSHYLDES